MADRLNFEPVIFRGCTGTEMIVLVKAAAAVWIPAGLLIMILLTPAIGMGVLLFGILGTVFFSATFFQRIKRGRPEFYYQIQVKKLTARYFWFRSPYIEYSGQWSLGRTE